MKLKIVFYLMIIGLTEILAQGKNEDPSFTSSDNLIIENTSVIYDSHLEQFIFSIQVKGLAGKSVPRPVGTMQGAPVLGYVFPTSLKSTDVGFGEIEGIVALALTSHPDFDDTPLWDENFDQDFGNDGIVWHPHWVVLNEDKRVAGGLSVKQFDPETEKVVLPPTNPGMPMYMDSPGYPVIAKEHSIKVMVPGYRIKNKTDFQFDAVTAYMEVNPSDSNFPLLGVYQVYSVASGNLSLPFQVTRF